MIRCWGSSQFDISKSSSFRDEPDSGAVPDVSGWGGYVLVYTCVDDWQKAYDARFVGEFWFWIASDEDSIVLECLGFFVPGFPKLSRFEAHFKKVLKKYRPRVYKHLVSSFQYFPFSSGVFVLRSILSFQEKNDIPYIYLTKWWFGCFLDRVPFSLALRWDRPLHLSLSEHLSVLICRLWDVYILEGDPILLAMALNIMKMHESECRSFSSQVLSGIMSVFSRIYTKTNDGELYGLHTDLPSGRFSVFGRRDNVLATRSAE